MLEFIHGLTSGWLKGGGTNTTANLAYDKIDEVGYKLAEFPQVSHCYRRPVFSDWPFNLFSMVHARTLKAAERIAETMSSTVKIQDYSILFSTREFKKQRVKYFE